MCCAGLFISCVGRKEQSEERVKAVKTFVVDTGGSGDSLSFPGKVKASAEAYLSFRISGPLARVNVLEGAKVRKGQVLAEMESRDYAVQLSATEAEYNRIKAEVDRVVTLHGQNSVSDNEYDKAVYGLQQITAKYNTHKNALADTRLTAPFDGYVQKVVREQGEMIGAGMPVLSILRSGAPEVEINLPAAEYIRRERFSSFYCTIDLYPGETFPLELVSIDHGANMNQLYRMRLRFREKPGTHLPAPGMTANVTILFANNDDNLSAIPTQAIFERNGSPYVWIIGADGKVEARQVTAARISTLGMTYCEGIKRGEMIVSAGVHALNDGDKVKAIAPVSHSNVGGLL